MNRLNRPAQPAAHPPAERLFGETGPVLQRAFERFVTPDEFDLYREMGLEMGFMEVVSGPLVRSSYRADRVFEQNNVGLGATVGDQAGGSSA